MAAIAHGLKLDTWAKRHGVSLEALNQLREIIIASNDEPLSNTASGESGVQNQVRVAFSKRGGRLWRNNVGAGMLDNGSFVRWGLANDSKKMNEHIKSHDLIGIKPIIITIDMIGCTIGQFVSRECKHPDWKYTGNDHETAQLRWAELITALGGDAGFTNGTS